MNLSGQDRDLGSDLRRGVLSWTLWVLASARGGAILTLIAEPLEIIGFLFLPGLILGTARALVLRRYLSYLPRGTSGVAAIWVFGSSVGWLAGCAVFVFVRALSGLKGVPEIAQGACAIIDQFVGSVSASDRTVHIVI